MDASGNVSPGMIAIMENLRSLQGEAGMNPDSQTEDMEPIAMPPPFDAAAAINRATASAAGKPMSFKKFLDKPKRPLSAYNIFFKHEREKLVSNTPDSDAPVTLESLKVDPQRKTTKRRHRKSHGKIGFADLARTIAEKWKTLDPESRKVFEACAAKEKERYQKEITEWKARKKTEAAADEAAIKSQLALNQDVLYNSTNMMSGSMANGNIPDTRNFDSTGGASWSSRTMTDGGSAMMNSQSQPQGQASSMGGVQDPRDYLKITQQVIDMARASLSLPLFANIGGARGGGMGGLDDSTMAFLGEQSSLRTSGNQASSMSRSNNMDYGGQLSNGALLNIPFGNNNMSSLDSDSLFQSQLMQSVDYNIQGYLNQPSQLRDELDARSFLNQQYQSELDSGPQDYADYGQNSQEQSFLSSLRNQGDQGLLASLRNQSEADQGLLSSLRNQSDQSSLYSSLRNQQDQSLLNSLRNQNDQQSLLNSLRNQASRQNDNDDLVNLINASLKDHY